MQRHAAAVEHLRSNDRVLREVIDRVGPMTLRQQRNRFWLLVRSIISQQISTAAATTIRQRLEALVDEANAECLGRVWPDQLREAGISAQKAGYLVDLCQAVRDGRLDLTNIGRQDDETAINQLIQVKGIGRWTAQMFLIFGLGRPDVLPLADLGLRTALRNLHRLPELPNDRQTEALTDCWRPFASAGSWYCWRSLELTSPSPPAASRARKQSKTRGGAGKRQKNR